MVWRIDDPQGNEAGKIAHRIVPYTRGEGADIGCGPHKAFPHMIGVDNCKDTELFNIHIKPDIDCDVRELPFKDESLDFIFSSHTLEHIEDAGAALEEWMRCIKPGGHLVLYLPHKNYYPNIGTPGSNPDHKHDFTNADVTVLMDSTNYGWELLVDEWRNQGTEYSLFQVYKKSEISDKREVSERACTEFTYLQHEKSVCVVRYGGFGDMLQAATVLPGLKAQGYHVTFMTTPKGREILEHDPNIDDWIIQDKDQVPNHWLPGYLKAWKGEFDHFVNLCESVEGTLLTIPGRADHGWPDAVRRARCHVNYHEFTAAIAGVPFEPHEKLFYPTLDEVSTALDIREQGIQFITFALSGSSHHKFYPGMDELIKALLLEYPHCRIALVGDEACKLLEQGWEKHHRVLKLSGELSIRDTLALAQHSDLVIGPETGVLNCVAFDENVGKVVMLSHSSHENLTKHWNRTNVIVPDPKIACYPCHRLHQNDEFCERDLDSGASICSASIPPGMVFGACADLLGDAGRKRTIQLAQVSA
ncbi:MAG: methyltransferase domain-containing protein [Paracoccaceae bacterium]